MPAFIIAAGITLGSQLWANNKRKKAAEEAEALLQAQVDARNDLIQGYNNDLDELMQNFEDGTLPVNKVIPEKGKVGGSAYDALETAKSDQAVENMIEVGEDNVAQAANISDPRIKQAVLNKAHKDNIRNIDKAQNDALSRVAQAEQNLGTMETKVEGDYASAKNQAESQYAQQTQSYLLNEQNRLNSLLAQQGENVFDAEYQAGTMVPFAQAQNAADFAASAGEAAGAGYTHFAEEGFKMPEKSDMDHFARFQEMMGGSEASASRMGLTEEELALAAEKYKKKRGDRRAIRDFERKSKAEGGLADGGYTKGEFNHGDPNRPETGNDQVLLDQEDLKKVMDQGGVNSFDELMEVVPPQVITTGGEIVKDQDNSSDEEDMTDATDISNPLKIEDIDFKDKITAEKAMNDVLLAKDGKRLFASKGKKNAKKTQEDVRKAEMLLAAYNRLLLSEPQFQG